VVRPRIWKRLTVPGIVRRWIYRLISLSLVGLIVTVDASAADGEEERGWNVSPLLGVHAPSLSTLNNGLFKSPFAFDANIFNNGNAQDSFVQHSIVKAPLSTVAPAALAGFEFTWRAATRHAFIIGIASWEQTQVTSAGTLFPVQGFNNNARVTRRATISFNEFSIGWRYDWFGTAATSRWYSRLGFHELFDIDYRDRWTILFLDGPSVGFKRLFVMDTQTTGALMFGSQLGWEKRLTKWMALGIEAGYVFGIGNVSLKQLVVNDTFRDQGDEVLRASFAFPARQNARGSVEYLSQDGTNYSPLHLSFGGWRATIKLTF